ncbi:hypothetical protein [Microbaculum marinisediminis]|uniref:Uncharacterized protein n=1 Tax=Microbaculum marinisediminis TaxID=2931392 RepID=A0AAW5QWY7_9HYPH|nr:hypothetical protein [Microbaculum sp. A6E488]MCT8971515.1 hypothetical protein [Microbaculum sp. A6E488]
MKKRILAGVLLVSSVQFAAAMETIGTITATVGDEAQQWEILGSDGDDAMAKAHKIGPVTSLEIHGGGQGQLVIEAIFAGSLSPDSRPQEVTVVLFPKGEGFMGNRWTSEGAGSDPQVTFDALEVGDESGQAEGSFAARLCRAKGFGDADTADCREISGRFATRLVVE